LSDRNSLHSFDAGLSPADATNARHSQDSESKRRLGIGRRFGDLRVRYKFMVLHNLFFLLLTASVYFTLAPFVESQLRAAQERETSLILDSFRHMTPEHGEDLLRDYDLRTGTADDFGLSSSALSYFRRDPTASWQRYRSSEHVYKGIPDSQRFYRITLPMAFYSELLLSVKKVVLSVLAVIYILAVIFLEFVILPGYVYRPIRVMLDADAASQGGDRAEEIVADALIPGDEIGQIMRSRNATVRELRAREDDLGLAAKDLQIKNDMLESAKRSLEAQDRLVSLGMLSASVAHEMNTPLAVLHGSIEKLIETASDSHVQSRLERMLRVTERLRQISAGLLDFARARPRERSPVELRPLIAEAWQLVAIDDKSAEVAFRNLVPSGERVRGNAGQLVQVFVNLLRNALNAVGPNGQISASSSARTLDGQPALAVYVEDNGPGIQPEVLPDIFDAFVTTRLDAHGTGLGLTVAEGIVNQHGGAINACNRSGGGARLEVVLPAEPEPQPSPGAD
jgi:signal transduction histidine kinase